MGFGAGGDRGDAVSEDMAYIARCKCGGVVMATVDNPDHQKENAKEIARCVRDGLTIERVSVEYVRSKECVLGCVCPKEPKTTKNSDQGSLFVRQEAP